MRAASTIIIGLVVLSRSATAQTVQVPPVVISGLTHSVHNYNPGNIWVSSNTAEFPCGVGGSGSCAGPGFSAAIGQGTTVVTRFEAPPGNRFVVHQGPAGSTQMRVLAEWSTGVVDLTSNNEVPTFVFENLTGTPPSIASTGNPPVIPSSYVSHTGQYIRFGNDFYVGGPFSFTALEVRFTVSQPLPPSTLTYSAVESAGSYPGEFSTTWAGGSPFYGSVMDIEPITPANPFCFGDGTGTSCPCGPGTTLNGCPNSVNPNGAHMEGRGLASITADSLTFTGYGMPSSTCLYFQGDQPAGFVFGDGVVFGDGLLCVTSNLRRLGTKLNVAGSSAYPSSGDVPISIQGACVAGRIQYYQAIYRNNAAFCTSATFNQTNGSAVLWIP